MSVPFIYATRSVIPSPFANAVQSANMAHAFSRLQEDFVATFRIQKKWRDRSGEVFANYGLNEAPNLFFLPSHPRLDWSEFYLPRFVRFLRRQPADATVYTRSGRMAWIASALGLRTTLELHDPLSRSRARCLRKMLRRTALPKLVATTSCLKQDLVAATGIDPDRVLVAGGAANRGFAELAAKKIQSPFPFNVGYAGSAFKGKGLEIVISCASRLPGVGFHVIGPTLEECEQFGSVGMNVVLHGRKSNCETVALLKSMDCLLLGNQRSVIIRNGADIGAHTSPLKMFEYMATGLPIVASDLSVVNGTLKNNKNALLCSPAEAGDFCQKILFLEKEPELRHRLGEQNLRDFRHFYTWDVRARTINNFIET